MPAIPNADPYKNKCQFFAALDDEEFRRLRPHMQMVSFKVGAIVCVRGDPARNLYFPVNACVSIVASVQKSRGVEVALVGPEGLVGLWAALGSRTEENQAVIQVAGDCVRIHTEVFRAELKRSASLRDHLHRYTRYLMAQISKTVVCNQLHRLEQRLARWLLMTRDHAKDDEFVVTHEFLSYMLGSDRSEVTHAAGILRMSGLISYARGRVKILDRKGLKALACDCYQIYADDARHLNQKEI